MTTAKLCKSGRGGATLEASPCRLLGWHARKYAPSENALVFKVDDSPEASCGNIRWDKDLALALEAEGSRTEMSPRVLHGTVTAA